MGWRVIPAVGQGGGRDVPGEDGAPARLRSCRGSKREILLSSKVEALPRGDLDDVPVGTND